MQAVFLAKCRHVTFGFFVRTPYYRRIQDRILALVHRQGRLGQFSGAKRILVVRALENGGGRILINLIVGRLYV